MKGYWVEKSFWYIQTGQSHSLLKGSHKHTIWEFQRYQEKYLFQSLLPNDDLFKVIEPKTFNLHYNYYSLTRGPTYHSIL